MTDVFITHGHGDHWFAAGLLAERFGARVVASAGTITQMHGSVAARPLLWDKLYAGLIPPSTVTAVTVPANRLTLEGHDLVIVEVGHTDSDDTSVLHVPDLGLVVAGDAIYNGVHMYLGQSAVGGFGPWRDAIGTVEALEPRQIVTGHQNRRLDDDAARTIAETRHYLDDAEELLRTENTATGFFDAKIARYPDHLGRMVLWVSARALYGVREHPERTPPRSPSAPGSDPRQATSRAGGPRAIARRTGAFQAKLSASSIAWAKSSGASCGRLWPMPPVRVRCTYLPVNRAA